MKLIYLFFPVFLFFSCEREKEIKTSLLITQTPCSTELKEEKGYVIEIYKQNNLHPIINNPRNYDFLFYKNLPLLNKNSKIEEVFYSLKASSKLIFNKKGSQDILRKLKYDFYDSLKSRTPIYIADSIEVRIIPCYLIFKDTVMSLKDYTIMGNFHSETYSFLTKMKNINLEEQDTMMYSILIHPLSAVEYDELKIQ